MRLRTVLGPLLALLIATAPASAQSMVVIGDSISAGFEGGFISGESQAWAYGGLVAVRTHEQYLAPTIIGALGTAVPDLAASANGFNPYAPLAPFGGRADTGHLATNLAVPGETLHGALARLQGDPGQIGAYFAAGETALAFHTLFNGIPWLFLPIVGSQVDLAHYLHPSTIVVWIGNNDVLAAAVEGLPLAATDPAEFDGDYREMLARLRTENPSARLLCVNIPDVSAVPRLETAPQADALFALPAGTTAAILGLAAGDKLNILDYALFLGSHGALPPSSVPVLTVAAQKVVAARVAAFNASIASAAKDVGAVLVDANGTFRRIIKHGVRVRVNGAQYILGAGYAQGIFAYDGVHPTKTGHAILANMILDALEDGFHARHLGRVDVDAVAATDPHLQVIAPLRNGRGHDEDEGDDDRHED